MDSEFFSGSFNPADITFLLRKTSISLTDVTLKEQLLQSGRRHYSEMLSREEPPAPMHLGIYRQALAAGAPRVARETLSLARAIAERNPENPIVLASLARAGVPLGVLLARALRFLGRDIRHFGISIIRDRGLDCRALEFIQHECPASEIIFVDGWTGKGAIANELYRAFPSAPLVVLADPCGLAGLSASHDDWLIPFGILGATVSGLISRTLWAADDFHGCRIWEELRPWDQSRAFVDAISSLWTRGQAGSPAAHDDSLCAALARNSRRLVDNLMGEYDVDSPNRIKPGLAEAARAILRRVPERVLISRENDSDTLLVRELARARGVAVEEKGEAIAPYRAVVIIKKAR